MKGHHYHMRNRAAHNCCMYISHYFSHCVAVIVPSCFWTIRGHKSQGIHPFPPPVFASLIFHCDFRVQHSHMFDNFGLCITCALALFPQPKNHEIQYFYYPTSNLWNLRKKLGRCDITSLTTWALWFTTGTL